MASQVEVDPQETREWLEALDAVVSADGPQRAQFLLERVVGHAQLTRARGDDAVPEHDPAAGRAASSRR
jgi:pyruvate dehydrogenase complex dehydrogenase (E1) component